MEKILITSEVATWVVNGVNVTFTTINPISTIRLIEVNGNEYAQYTFSWNSIVLDDAPSAWSVEVTYEYEYNLDYLQNSNWITWEILSGTVNWTNKLFKSFYPISLLDEVRVDGTPTVAYTFNGNSILFTVAPTTWVVDIDYFRKDLQVIDYSKDNYYTLAEIRTKVYDKIGEDGGTTARYPIDLVNDGLIDWLNEICSILIDKYRNVTYSVKVWTPIALTPIDNSITTLTTGYSEQYPSKGRIITYEGDFVDYTSKTSAGIIWWITCNNFPIDSINGFVGYRLPRNWLRVASVYVDNYQLREFGDINEFLARQENGYLINNGYIYFSRSGDCIVNVEVNEYLSNSLNDNTVIYVDKADVSVVIYYCLRQVYAEREDDKLTTAAELYQDKLKSYKRKIWKKRARDAGGVMKTISII